MALQFMQTLTGSLIKNEPLESKESVVATARIKTIPKDVTKIAPIAAVPLEVSGTINASAGSVTKQSSKRCIIFVIDKSGSMSGSRMNTVREAVIPFIEEFCENEHIMIKLILFESNAVSFDIPKDRMSAKLKLENILSAGGGTDFSRASDTLVTVSQQILSQHRDHEITVVICSDGEVSKSNAQQAHKTWKKFVNDQYIAAHKQVPFVESIGISSNHDADILDGFIMNDDNGNYSRANDSEAIRESFERAAQNAAMRETFTVSISSANASITFIENLYHEQHLKSKQYTLSEADFLLTVWLDKKAFDKRNDDDLYIVLNDNTKVKISVCNYQSTEEGKIQQQVVDFYHQLLKDMICTLRNIQDETSLKQEAKRIQDALAKYEAIFLQITAQPAELAELEASLKQLLNTCEQLLLDEIEKRVLRLKHYKTVRLKWKRHRIIVSQFNSTLKALKDLLQEILTGKTRMQEIRQHILDLHFSKKHAKRMNKLILTDEQLMKRQQMYDNIQQQALDDNEVKDMCDELGSGCFLSTMTLKECAIDGQSLWLCGRVHRSGGVMVSNPEIIRIQYISPDLVSNEYFQMAMDIQGLQGFYDGSRHTINARLFPVYGGNMEYLKISKPYLMEALSHTLSGRCDIKINDYSTLSAVLGYMIATHSQSTKNICRIFKDILPSYVMLAKYIKVFPYKNEKNKEIDFKAKDKMQLLEFFESRLKRYCNTMQVRCSSLISNVQCLFGDALLCDKYSLLLQPQKNVNLVWFSMLAQRMRSLIKGRIPGDQALFTQARKAEINHAEALRVIIRGTDCDNDMFVEEDIKQEDDGWMLKYFEIYYKAQEEKDRKAPFDIPACKSLTSDDIDLSSFDPHKITPSQIQLCAQILARVHFKDLIQAHRFFRILHEIKSENADVQHIIANVDRFKWNEKNTGTLTALCDELQYKLCMSSLRALCGFILLIYTNSSFQNLNHCGIFEELLSNPSVVIQFLHEKVISESKRKPRRMVARIKHKPLSCVDLAKRREHSNIFPHQLMNNAYDEFKWVYWKDIDLAAAPHVNIAITGHHLSGKSTLFGRLLFDLNALSPRLCKEKQSDTQLKSGNEFAKLVHNQNTCYEPMGAFIKSNDNSSIIRIHDTPNPQYYRNVYKTLPAMDGIIFCIPALGKKFEESMQRINAKKGIAANGATLALPHCLKALVDTEIIICCITMMDQVQYEQKQYEEIKTQMIKMLHKRGYREKRLIFIPICSLQMTNNIANISTNMLWFKGFEITVKHQQYKGQTLYDALNILSKLNVAKMVKKKKKALKVFVSGKMKIKGIGFVFYGMVIEGSCAVGDEIKFIPSGIHAKIASLQKYYKDVKEGTAGDTICLTVKVTNNKPVNDIIVGDIACGVNDKQLDSKREIDALIFVANMNVVSRIRSGYRALLFLGCDHVSCSVKQIKWKVAINASGKTEKINNPMYIEAGDQAHVVLTLQKPMAISKFDQFKANGRFVVVSGNSPIFYGKIC